MPFWGSRMTKSIRSVLGRIFVPIIFALASNPAQADWSGPLAIQTFLPTDQNATIVVPSTDNPLGCGSPTWLRINISDPNYALISSTLLTAFTQGKPVKVFLLNCLSDGSVHISAVWLDR